MVGGDSSSTGTITSNGGDVEVVGGESGSRSKSSRGGDIRVVGGKALGGVGGSINFLSGTTHGMRSGSIIMKTSDTEDSPSSGEIIMETGTTGIFHTTNQSGNIRISTGTSEMAAGEISISTGRGRGGEGASLRLLGGAYINPRYPGTKTQKTGSNVELSAGSGIENFVNGGSLWIRGGRGGTHARSGSIFIETSTNSWEKDTSEIALAVKNDPNDSSYSFRLKATSTGNMVISNVPIQVTHVQYSSDERIKKEIAIVDTDDLLDRVNKIEFTEYGYSDQWRQVRGIADKRVRGIIAQQIQSIFPEHITKLDSYVLPDKDFSIDDFLQVDKQGLVMDLMGAFQAQSKRFSVMRGNYSHSADLKISSDDAGHYFGADNLGSTGNIALNTGVSTFGSSGSIHLETGRSMSSRSGNIWLRTGSNSKGSTGDVQIETSNSTTNNSGDIMFRGGNTLSGAHSGSSIIFFCWTWSLWWSNQHFQW